MASDVTTAIGQADPNQAIDGPYQLSEWVARRTEDLRFVAFLTSVLAMIGALLCAAGVYALTSCWVNESRHELAVRRSIGADDRHTLAWFGRRRVMVVASGLIAGLFVQGRVVRLLVAPRAGTSSRQLD